MEKLKGLTSFEVKQKQIEFGKNELTAQKKESFFKKVIGILSEPMFILLLLTSTIYFVLGEPFDGAIMLVFVIAIIAIEVFQEWKTDKTINALKDLSAPQVRVVRDSKKIEITSTDLVPGDIMIIQEGVKIPADGYVLRCNDLCVDESSLTGEADGVWKVATDGTKKAVGYWRNDYCYAGTLVTQGTAVICVDKIGKQTQYGKIGANVAETTKEKTPLQKQISGIITLYGTIAIFMFIGVGIITWLNVPTLPVVDRVTASVLAGITLAMTLIPEEFPVILAVFLSMGAWRLVKKNSLVRKLPAVETLGAISVLCVDKTGTITMNQMECQEVWVAEGDEVNLIEVMGLACETDAYDPMEKAMLDYCEKRGITRKHLFAGRLISEYAFTNELKMMGHIWHHDGEIVIAAKGSPEHILTICKLDEMGKKAAENRIREMSERGLRVIAVAMDKPKNEKIIPANILDCSLTLCGLIGLADPPRETISDDIARCYKAGIRVVMITGDNGVTAMAIAKKVGIRINETLDSRKLNLITGDMIEKMTDEELRESVKEVTIFSRVIPEHKMRIVKAFKDNGEIVAMTGDGVNDAPALKYADIGVAMGKRGSEVSREAADLVLLDDNFSTIIDTVRDGRRIFDNIRKAVGYVFTIHIPIAFAALLAPALGIKLEALLFLPVIVVLLELLIDPTCAIVLERQPAELDVMERVPRNPHMKMMTYQMMLKSVLQGFAIFAASFGAYYYMLLANPNNAASARAMGVGIIIVANLFLVQVNSSDSSSVFVTFKHLVKDKVLWVVNSVIIFVLFAMLYTPVGSFLKMGSLSAVEVLVMFSLGAISVLWYEIVKLVIRRRKQILS